MVPATTRRIRGAGFPVRESALFFLMTQPEQQIKGGVDLGRVRVALEPVFGKHGVRLVDLEWVTERTGWTLRITIEREGGTATNLAGGVTLEDCSEVSKDASAVLDAPEAEDIIPHNYHLEVSSPGLDRPLRTAADFARFSGMTVKVKLSKPASDGQRVLRGPLDASKPEIIAVLVDGKRIEAPLADVVEAQLVFELVPQAKKKPGPRKSQSAKR
jgi:ribosome maturation factor RimP